MKQEMTNNTLSRNVLEAIHQSNIENLSSLIDANSIENSDKDGRTALLHAVLSKNLKVMKYLITLGCQINVSDKNGWSPLHYAAQSGNLEMAQILIDSKIQVDMVDHYGNTALGRAVFNSKGDGEMIKLLLKNGADPNLSNNAGISPLKLANTIANYDVKQFFK